MSFFQLVAHELGHVIGMWHPLAGWRTNDCATTGLMGPKWYIATKWESCAQLDFKAMYNYYIIQRGYKWCLTTTGTGNKTKGTRLKKKINLNFLA